MAVERLIREEHVTQADLLRAENAMQESNLRTRQFFDTIAGKWEGLKKSILGGFDINGEIS